MLNKIAAIGLTLGLALSPMAAFAQTGQSTAPAASAASHSKATGSHRTFRRQASMHKQELSMHKPQPSAHKQRVSMHKPRAKATALAATARRS